MLNASTFPQHQCLTYGQYRSPVWKDPALSFPGLRVSKKTFMIMRLFEEPMLHEDLWTVPGVLCGGKQAKVNENCYRHNSHFQIINGLTYTIRYSYFGELKGADLEQKEGCQQSSWSVSTTISRS